MYPSLPQPSDNRFYLVTKAINKVTNTIIFIDITDEEDVEVFGTSHREEELKESCEGSDLATLSIEGSDTETTRITIEEDNESKIANEEIERDILRGYKYSTETEER